MEDRRKTKAELIDELIRARQRIDEIGHGDAARSKMLETGDHDRMAIDHPSGDALAIARATSPRHIGRPWRMTDETRQHVADLRASGLSLAAVADRLNAENVPTVVPGARWHIATVRKVLASLKYEAEIAARQSA